MNRIAMTLHKDELERLHQIMVEGDKDGALLFVSEVLEEKVRANELPHCMPFFDVGYSPGQADSFKRNS